MEITAALAAHLRTLTEALDDPEADLAQTLERLAADTKVAVHSYLGLSVTIAIGGQRVLLTTLDDSVADGHIAASLRVHLASDGVEGHGVDPTIALILYAATPGAFVDLAADLAWLTGRGLSEFMLDQHLDVASRYGAYTSADTVGTLSTINQAIGVLIAWGHPPEQALVELDARARRVGVDRHTAATLILAILDNPGTDTSTAARTHAEPDSTH